MAVIVPDIVDKIQNELITKNDVGTNRVSYDLNLTWADGNRSNSPIVEKKPQKTGTSIPYNLWVYTNFGIRFKVWFTINHANLPLNDNSTRYVLIELKNTRI